MYNAITSIFPFSSISAKSNKLNFASKMLWFWLFLTAFSLVIACVYQINAQAGETFLIKEYEQKIAQLTEENKSLEINFSKSVSLENIGTFVQNQTFEKTAKMEYIRVLEGTALAK